MKDYIIKDKRTGELIAKINLDSSRKENPHKFFYDANFKGLNLRNFCFKDANLEYAVFDSCDLTDVNFENANLKNVHFKSSTLNGTSLKNTLREQIIFPNSTLQDVIIEEELVLRAKDLLLSTFSKFATTDLVSAFAEEVEYGQIDGRYHFGHHCCGFIGTVGRLLGETSCDETRYLGHQLELPIFRTNHLSQFFRLMNEQTPQDNCFSKMLLEWCQIWLCDNSNLQNTY